MSRLAANDAEHPNYPHLQDLPLYWGVVTGGRAQLGDKYWTPGKWVYLREPANDNIGKGASTFACLIRKIGRDAEEERATQLGEKDETHIPDHGWRGRVALQRSRREGRR